jgi:hypothetical protein
MPSIFLTRLPGITVTSTSEIRRQMVALRGQQLAAGSVCGVGTMQHEGRADCDSIMTPCSLVGGDPRFEGNYCLNLQGITLFRACTLLYHVLTIFLAFSFRQKR